MENQMTLCAKVASLESKVDMLESELIYLDALLRRCGFPEGIADLKFAAEDLLNNKNSLL